MNIKKIMEEVNDEMCKFEKVVTKFSNRADLHAFILLDKILPNSTDIISATAYKSIFIDIDIKKLEKVISYDQIVELVRCGICYESDYDCLYKFV